MSGAISDMAGLGLCLWEPRHGMMLAGPQRRCSGGTRDDGDVWSDFRARARRKLPGVSESCWLPSWFVFFPSEFLVDRAGE